MGTFFSYQVQDFELGSISPKLGEDEVLLSLPFVCPLKKKVHNTIYKREKSVYEFYKWISYRMAYSVAVILPLQIDII